MARLSPRAAQGVPLGRPGADKSKDANGEVLAAIAFQMNDEQMRAVAEYRRPALSGPCSLHEHGLIAALNVYPVKGCGGIARAGTCCARGLTLGRCSAVSDREWMIVERWTLRDPARAAGCARTRERRCRRAPVEPSGRIGVRRFAGVTARTGPEVVVWRDTVRAHDAGDTAAAWLTRALDATCARALRSRSGAACNPEYAGDSGAHTQFADGYRCWSSGKRRSTT
jgi:hypothetical protein